MLHTDIPAHQRAERLGLAMAKGLDVDARSVAVVKIIALGPVVVCLFWGGGAPAAPGPSPDRVVGAATDLVQLNEGGASHRLRATPWTPAAGELALRRAGGGRLGGGGHDGGGGNGGTGN